jgi:Tfp pilus assembly protein PilO
MADLAPTRKRLTTAFVVLAVVDLLCIAALFSPLVGSEKARLDELDQLRVQLRQKQQQVDRVGDIDKKIVLADKQIDTFYKERLPGRDSAISANLGQLASESGVQLAQVKYTPDDKPQAGLRTVEIEADLSGQYPQLARFLNALERSSLFLIVDSVELGGEQQNTVRLHMQLRTFLKTGA